MAKRTVRMVHENVRGVYDAPECAVDHWKARGWSREDEKPAPKTAAKMTAKAVEKGGGDRG